MIRYGCFVFLFASLLAANSFAGTWVSANGNLTVSNLNRVMAVPNTDKVVAALHCFGMWSTTNGGSSWTKLGGAAADNMTNIATDIIFDPIDPNTFWEVGIYGGANCSGWGPGVFKTNDGGVTFSAVGGLAHNDGFAVDFSDPQRLVQIATGHETPRAMWKSNNGGVSFIDIGASIPAGTSVTSGIHVINSTTYVVTVGGYGGGTDGIFRTIDGGTTWTNVAPGMLSTWGCAFSAISSGELFLIAKSGGLLKGSADGSSWTTISCSATGSQPPFDIPGGKIAVLGSSSILVSSDKGATWQSIGSSLPTSGASGLTYNSVGGAFYLWKSDNGIWRYDTMLQAGLNIYALSANPNTVYNDQATSVTFSVHAATSSGTVSSVTIDLTAVGGGAAVAMTKGSGDLYSCSFSVPAGQSTGTKTVTATVTDNSSNTKTAAGAIVVKPPLGNLKYLSLYSDTSVLTTSMGWGGPDTAKASALDKLTEVSAGAYEGTKCLDFNFQVSGWWAGFGMVWNSWNYLADMSTADSLCFEYKGLTNVRFKMELEMSSGGTTTAASMSFGGTGNWAHASIPITFYTSAGYDVSSIREMNFVITGSDANNPGGHLYFDNIYLVGANLSTGVSPKPGRLAADTRTRISRENTGMTYDISGRIIGGDASRQTGRLCIVKSHDGKISRHISGVEIR